MEKMIAEVKIKMFEGEDEKVRVRTETEGASANVLWALAHAVNHVHEELGLPTPSFAFLGVCATERNSRLQDVKVEM